MKKCGKIDGKELRKMMIEFGGEKEYYKRRRQLHKDYRRHERQGIKELRMCGGNFDTWYVNKDRRI